MNFTIIFHGPFRVATGLAAPGVDIAVDVNALIPEASLKGVMRQAAESVGVSTSDVEAVFGTPRSPSPWSWLPLSFDEAPKVIRRAQTMINPETGTVVEGGLIYSQEVWATRARFEVVTRFNRADVSRHQNVLALSALNVRSLGGGRNRGLGWVSVIPDHKLTLEEARTLVNAGLHT